MIKGLLVSVFLLFSSHFHPFHVSLADVEYDEDQKSLQISCRIFQDDLELALNKIHNVDNYFDRRDNELIKRDLNDLLSEQFQFKINGTSRQYEFLGYEFEEGVVWCYMEITKVRNLKKLEVEYTVLFETFDDQFNLLNLKRSGKMHSLRFSKTNPEGTLEFDD